MNLNLELLFSFLRCRKINGMPSQIDVLAAIQRTKTRTYLPEGWQWR
jgi:hypothetical protein